MHWYLSCGSLLTWAAVKFGAGQALASDATCIGINAVRPECKPAEPPYHRDVFFIGGEYVASGTSYIRSDQMYVEKLTPASGVGKPFPVVFISAGLPSGNVWLNTPDNRKGWASFFLDKGYQVYIVDITANGRSAQNDISKYPLRPGSTVSIHESGFTAPENLNAYPQSQGHDRWPGNGTRGDPVFDAFFSSTGPLTSNSTAQELSMRAAGCGLLSLVGPSFLVGHSAGATYSALMSDECPEQVRATVNLEPGNGHFFFLEENNLELAAVVEQEIARRS